MRYHDFINIFILKVHNNMRYNSINKKKISRNKFLLIVIKIDDFQIFYNLFDKIEVYS